MPIAIDRHCVVCRGATERITVRAISHIFKGARVLQEHPTAIQKLHAERVRVPVACRSRALCAGINDELLWDGLGAGHQIKA